MSGMLISLRVQIVAGAVGGNVAGAVKNLSLDSTAAFGVAARSTYAARSLWLIRAGGCRCVNACAS